MVAEALESHLLFGHQLAGILVHLGVVNAQAAEDGKSLKNRGIRFGEGNSVGLFKYSNDFVSPILISNYNSINRI